MKILKTNLYLGPNQYAKFKVIRHVLDIGVLEDWPSAKIGSEFVDGLVEALPGLHEHGCSYRVPGGFIRRLREDEGTWMAHIIEHVALELQCVAGNEVTFGRTRSTGEVGQYNMVYAYIHKDVGLAACELAIKLLMHLLPKDLQKKQTIRLKKISTGKQNRQDLLKVHKGMLSALVPLHSSRRQRKGIFRGCG